MSLDVTEIFGSFQGEGCLAGWKTTFVRLAGCNLRCPWCDTQYSQDSHQDIQMTTQDIIQEIEVNIPGRRLLTITGGEPLLQKGESLKELLLWGMANYDIVSIETNGTIDWEELYKDKLRFVHLTVSPKPPNYDVALSVRRPQEIKLVVTDDLPDIVLEVSERLFSRAIYFLQPCGITEEAVKKALAMQDRHPKWIFRMQMHKYYSFR